MADKKITELTELTITSDNDLLVVVDISDTDMSVSGTTKKVSIENLLKSLIRPSFSQIEDVTVSNTLDESTLLGSGRGTKTIDAYSLDVGTAIRLELSGYLSTTGTPTLNISISLGVTKLCETGSITLETVSEVGWTLEAKVSCKSTGESGHVKSSGTFKYDDGYQYDFVNISGNTINTGEDLEIDITAQWDTADAGNTITCQEATIEIMKADGLAVAAPSGLTATEV